MGKQSRDIEALCREFEERGFLVIPNAISSQQVSILSRAFDRFMEEYPEEWVHLSSANSTAANVLPSVDDFDFAIENPVTLNILRMLIGEDVTFEEFDMMLRQPTNQSKDIKGWHRDLTRDHDRRMEIDAVAVVYYLTDVSAEEHCFSIIPETHNRLVDLRPEQVAPGMEFDVMGPAGTALIFHARCLHAGKLKLYSKARKTLHIYYSRAGKPRTSEWSDIPARLYQKVDASLPPHLYSKWKVKDVFEGTGRKPRDLDPSLSSAEMIREVQRRANQNAQN
jgi:ectoine hydroxylase-related dioxygenase (phytanoyl-CoA dioxygenase family)